MPSHLPLKLLLLGKDTWEEKEERFRPEESEPVFAGRER